MESSRQAGSPGGYPSSEIFDFATTLEQVGGETELLESLIAAHLEQEPMLLRRLTEAAQLGNPLEIRKAGHALASSVSVLHAARSRDAARTVEYLGRDGKLSGLAEAVRLVEGEFLRLRKILENPDSRLSA